MKFYSEVLDKIFDTEKELNEAEAKAKKQEVLDKEKKERKAIVDKALDKAVEAYKEYSKLMGDYLLDYEDYTSGNKELYNFLKSTTSKALENLTRTNKNVNKNSDSLNDLIHNLLF